MSITDPQYTNSEKKIIRATVDGRVAFIPCTPSNRHYAEILKQVKAGTLTIKDAD